MGDSQYSFSLTTFSPSGKLVQIEYALNAVAAGATSLGIKATNGVVIATEKKLPTELIDETSVKKIQLLTDNSGVVYSGIGPDSRVLVRKSRKSAQSYYSVYKVSHAIATLCHASSQVHHHACSCPSPAHPVPHAPSWHHAVHSCGRRAFRRHSWCSPPRAVPHMPIAVPHMPIPVPHVPIPVPHMPIAVPHMPIPVPHVPIPVPHMPIAVPHMPIAVPHMPIAVPHMPIAVPHMPIVVLLLLTPSHAHVTPPMHVAGGHSSVAAGAGDSGGHAGVHSVRGPHLYQVDPSGSYFAWKASAIGKNMTNAKTFLEKRYTEDMELEDAIHTAILTLKEGYVWPLLLSRNGRFEGQIAGDNIEIGIVGSDKKFRVLTPAEVNDYLAEVE
ncbi:unnamed protein product [Closterium sp. NIES-64]|nr:unnamed protein product [Closterium sp. NIES-64]